MLSIVTHLHNAAGTAALILNLPVKRGQRKLAYSAEREEPFG